MAKKKPTVKPGQKTDGNGTATAPVKAPAKKGRVCRWMYRGVNFGVLKVIDGKQEDDYILREVSAVSCTFTKMEGRKETVYHVFVNRPKAGVEPLKACGCEGFHNRQTCRHVEAVLALRAKGEM